MSRASVVGRIANQAPIKASCSCSDQLTISERHETEYAMEIHSNNVLAH